MLVDAAGDGVAVDLVVLVVGEVPVDRGFLGGQLFLDVGQFVLVSGAGLVLVVAGGGDRLLRLVEVVGVEVAEGGDDQRIEGVGVDAGCVAAVDAVPVAGVAGVVAVATRGRSW